jgi:GTP cyclohydrolase FolE2
MSRYFEELDVAKTKINDARRLDRVGMSDIECPVTISVEGQPRQLTSGKADAFVSLDEAQKGIHMSHLPCLKKSPRNFLKVTMVLAHPHISRLVSK